MHGRWWWVGGLSLVVAACAPALDWREVRSEGSRVVALLPCKPERFERGVEVAGARVRMRMMACEAGGATWALSHFEVADPAAVAPALQALRAAAVANVAGRDPRFQPWSLAGATSNEETARLAVDGRLPDGAAVREHAVFFVDALVVHQASVIGATVSEDAAQALFTGLKLAR